MKKRLADVTESGLQNDIRENNIFLVSCPACDVITETASKDDADFYFFKCCNCGKRMYIRFNLKTARSEVRVYDAAELLLHPDAWPMVQKVAVLRKKDMGVNNACI